MVESQPTRDIGHVFVGRQREMAELRAALDDALGGRGRLVMLAGEPGIGKTRTAQELAVPAEQRGTQVFWGWCYEGEGAPPYWPWVRPMRAYVQQTAAEQLTSEMGPGAADLAEIVAEVRGKLPDLETPPLLEPEPARFRLFDSITTFLKNAAQRQPLMLVLDDLHWADRSSLLLLEFLAREIGNSQLLLVGSYRDVEVSRRHPLSQTLGALVREQLFHWVKLDALTRQEVGELVEGSARITLTLEAAELIHKRTDGNPFFVGEIARQVTLGNITEDEDWTGIIPEGVRDAIRRRLSRLSDQYNQMLTAASVIGQGCEFRLLSSLIRGPAIAGTEIGSMAEDQLLAAMDEAVGAHLIEELPHFVGRYQFTHALVRETLLEELSTTRRMRLHARIAQALEELYVEGAEARAAELAHHYFEAQIELGTDKLARYSLMAGEQALASYANEDALAHFERGLVPRDISLSGTEAASDEEAAALLFGLARARAATVVEQQLVEAFALLLRAFEFYASAGYVALAVAAAEFPIAPTAARMPGVAELMVRALALVPPESHEAGRLLSRYGGTLGAGDDYEGAQEALRCAITIARNEGDVPLEVQACSYAAVVNGQHLRWQESVDNGLRAIELAAGDETPFSDVVSRYWTAVCLLYLGNLNATRPHALVLRDLAERRSTPRQLAALGFAPITALSCLEGDWNAGREYSDRGLDVSPLNPQVLFPRVMLEHETGESAQGDAYLERLLEATRPWEFLTSARLPMAMAAIARITGAFYRLELAEAAAESYFPEQSNSLGLAMWAKVGMALLAVQKGDQLATEEHYAYLQGQRGTMITTVISVDRLLGLLSQTMRNTGQALAHFEDALAFCGKAGYRPELAWSYCDYADALLDPTINSRRTTRESRQKAVSLLDESVAISSELGMRPLMERLTARLERIQARRSTARAYPDGLTQREVEVLRLISTGKTDREIAEELVISRLTVGNHVKNILNKTNSGNRTEAAVYAAHHGMA